MTKQQRADSLWDRLQKLDMEQRIYVFGGFFGVMYSRMNKFDLDYLETQIKMWEEER